MWIGKNFLFFHFKGNTPVRRDCLKIISNGAQIELPNIFSMRIFMLSCPGALLDLKWWLYFPLSLPENVTVGRRFSLIYLISEGSELWLETREHCLEKKKMKSSAFPLKFVSERFSQNTGGGTGIFLFF